LDGVKKSTFVVAEHQNKIVGTYGYVAFNFKIGSKMFATLYGDDTATDPNYRGQGIYTKIVNFNEKM
jgi:hypothetical protein